MSKLATDVIVSSFAILLASSAFYVFSEKNRYSTFLYGYPPVLTIPPNTNATIPLVYVSDRHEIGSLAIALNTWEFWNFSSSISKPSSYSSELSFYATVHVNKSAFVLLEESGIYGEENRTVNAVAFHSANFPADDRGYTEAQPIQSNIQPNKFYQLKIANYETFIVNQTGPFQFTTQETNRTLEAVISTSLYSSGNSAPREYIVTISFNEEPNTYLVASLLVADGALITIYFITSRKTRNQQAKTSSV